MNKVLGFERINERTKRPNALINFIKPLETPDKVLAQDFLERVAAICYPIMKANHIAVMALEEYAPNPEFVGRNFNAGEVIQLVLKAQHTNQWLPFQYVQMVMMHELAHCKQMNHSGAFWKVRNEYADELKGLWNKDYTGEGLWGRGQSLISGQYMTNHMPAAADAPRSLCGGTYRSSGGRKRKRKEDRPKVTYAERQQRRIAKKFGTNGVALGDDEGIRTKLESGQKGKKPVGKPRVAGSNRGRELRAAAALARFETVKKEPVKVEPKSEIISDDDYETDSDYEEAGRSFNPNDSNVVKVCENEDAEDGDARRELDELRQIDNESTKPQLTQGKDNAAASKKIPVVLDDSSTDSEDDQEPRKQKTSTRSEPKKKLDVADDASTASEDEVQEITAMPTRDKNTAKPSEPSKTSPGFSTLEPPPADEASTASENEDDSVHPTINTKPTSTTSETTPVSTSAPDQSNTTSTASGNIATSRNTGTTCPICSLENEPAAALCAACSNVLKPSLMPNAWKCQSENCRRVGYVNPADYGVCGLCGGSKL